LKGTDKVSTIPYPQTIHCIKSTVLHFYAIDKLNKDKNSSGDEIANVNFFYNIVHVEASAYAH